ncbi:hypothetical protein [Reyranella sp.]|jgi:hypothetical protein|uniref:hypothetical protein n=1 Tax=Reyranella sp. TaxID=1929291 RepID=UPI002F93A59F
MLDVRLPEDPNPTAKGHAAASRDRAVDKPNPDPLESELLDLYGAIAIAIPVALFLNSLWL